MLRDELVRALQAQPHDTDVQVDIGGFLIDLVRVDYDDNRTAIVLDVPREDLEDVVLRVARRPWWRVNPAETGRSGDGEEFTMTNPNGPQAAPLIAPLAAEAVDNPDEPKAGPTVGASDAEADAAASGADADLTDAHRDDDGVPVGEADAEADRRASGA